MKAAVGRAEELLAGAVAGDRLARRVSERERRAVVSALELDVVAAVVEAVPGGVDVSPGVERARGEGRGVAVGTYKIFKRTFMLRCSFLRAQCHSAHNTR